MNMAYSRVLLEYLRTTGQPSNDVQGYSKYVYRNMRMSTLRLHGILSLDAMITTY